MSRSIFQSIVLPHLAQLSHTTRPSTHFVSTSNRRWISSTDRKGKAPAYAYAYDHEDTSVAHSGREEREDGILAFPVAESSEQARWRADQQSLGMKQRRVQVAGLEHGMRNQARINHIEAEAPRAQLESYGTQWNGQRGSHNDRDSILIDALSQLSRIYDRHREHPRRSDNMMDGEEVSGSSTRHDAAPISPDTLHHADSSILALPNVPTRYRLPLPIRQLLHRRLYNLATSHILQTPLYHTDTRLLRIVAQILEREKCTKLARTLRAEAAKWKEGKVMERRERDEKAPQREDTGEMDGVQVIDGQRAEQQRQTGDLHGANSSWRLRPLERTTTDATSKQRTLTARYNAHLSTALRGHRIISSDHSQRPSSSSLSQPHPHSQTPLSIFTDDTRFSAHPLTSLDPTRPFSTMDHSTSSSSITHRISPSALPKASGNFNQLRLLLLRIAKLERHRGFVPDIVTGNLVVGCWLACWKRAQEDRAFGNKADLEKPIHRMAARAVSLATKGQDENPDTQTRHFQLGHYPLRPDRSAGTPWTDHSDDSVKAREAKKVWMARMAGQQVEEVAAMFRFVQRLYDHEMQRIEGEVRRLLRRQEGQAGDERATERLVSDVWEESQFTAALDADQNVPLQASLNPASTLHPSAFTGALNSPSSKCDVAPLENQSIVDDYAVSLSRRTDALHLISSGTTTYRHGRAFSNSILKALRASGLARMDAGLIKGTRSSSYDSRNGIVLVREVEAWRRQMRDRAGLLDEIGESVRLGLKDRTE